MACYVFQTEEEYNEIMESDDVKEMKEAHEKLRESLELELLESLKEFKSSQFKVSFNASENEGGKEIQFLSSV